MYVRMLTSRLRRKDFPDLATPPIVTTTVGKFSFMVALIASAFKTGFLPDLKSTSWMALFWLDDLGNAERTFPIPYFNAAAILNGFLD